MASILPRKDTEIFRTIDAESAFAGEVTFDRAINRIATGLGLDGNADRAAFGGDILDLDQPHAESLKKQRQRPDFEVRQMLVIDRIEQVALGDVDAVLGLENKYAVGRQYPAYAFDKAVEVVDIGDHVVGDDHVRGAVFLRNLAAQILVEEFRKRFDAILRGASGDLDGRVDAEHAHSLFLEIPQQRSVVAADLDDEGRRRQAPFLRDPGRRRFEMFAQPKRDRGRIDVVAVLNFRVADMEDLQVAAVAAVVELKRHGSAKHRGIPVDAGDFEIRRRNRHFAKRRGQVQ